MAVSFNLHSLKYEYEGFRVLQNYSGEMDFLGKERSTSSNRIESELNKNSFFPISKTHFLMGFLLLSISLVLLILGSTNRFAIDENLKMNFRLTLFVIGPLITFFALFSFLNYVFYSESFRPSFKIIFEFSIIGGLVSLLLALTLNSRGVLIQLALLVTTNETIAIFVGPAIIAPLVEELGKGLPIYYLSKGLITRENSEKEYRVFHDIKTPIYVGAITGLMFNLLETYWYIWNGGYLFALDDSNIWTFVILQIVIRSTNLLHILNASIIGLGIGLSLYNSNKKVLTTREYSYGFLGYLVAFGIHALWNGSLVLATEDTPSIIIYGIDFPIFNLVLLIVTFIGLFLLWIYVSRFEITLCTYCEEWHAEPYDKESHYIFDGIKIGFYDQFKNAIFKSRTVYSCPNCKSKIGAASFCVKCNSQTSFNCSNCTVSVPAHATACWNCSIKIEPPFQDIIMFPETNSSILAKPVLYILTGFYISASITILIAISRSISTDGAIDQTADRLLIVYLFLFLIGLSFLRIVRWINNPFSYSMGYSLARTIFSMLIFQFAMIFIAIGLILAYIPGFTFSGILFLIESIIFIHYGFSIMFNFSPLFHLVENERLMS